MHILAVILVSVFLVSIISLVGIFSLGLSDKFLKKMLFILVAFAAGAMLGVSFLELLPEAIEHSDDQNALKYVLSGIILFFVLERFIFWHHCHDEKCDVHAFSYLNLIGDGIHNFIDGAIIAASFMTSIPLGLATTLAIIFHEIPQEIGDFGILVYGGFSKYKALFYNFLSALTSFLGALLVFFFARFIENALPFLLALAAGSFIYIASTDLLPELKKEVDKKTSIIQLASFLVGVTIIWSSTKIF
ncbi:MAG: ZIP family metal transporter [Candidatus Hydrothermarchaeaceae archaeon]